MKHTLQTISDLVKKITYKDWTIKILVKDDGFLLQPIFNAPDQYSKQMEEQHCRKWYVSQHSCDSEIIRTCYLAIQQGEMHELSENFMFNGQRIYNPHLNLKRLADIIEHAGPYAMLETRDNTHILNEH